MRPKIFHHNGGQHRDGVNYRARPKFDPAALLNQPCAFHSRDGKPATHTTTDYHSLKEIEKARHAREDPNNNPPNGGHSATRPARSTPSLGSAPSTRISSSPAPSLSTRCAVDVP